MLLSLGGVLIMLSLSTRWLRQLQVTCTGSAIALIMGYSFSGSAYFLRAFALLAQATYARAIQNVKLDVHDMDDAASLASHESVATYMARAVQSISLLAVCVRLLFGLDLVTPPRVTSPSKWAFRHSREHGSPTSTLAESKESAAIVASRLDVLSQLHLLVTPNIIILNSILWGLPGIVGIIVLVSIDSLYVSPCSCPGILLDGAIIALIMVSLYCMLSMRILWLCRNVEESYGVLKELLLSAGGCGVFMLTGWGLVIADPNELSITNAIPWEWIIMVGGVYFHFIWVWVALYQAFKEKRLRDSNHRDGRLDANTPLSDQMHILLFSENPNQLVHTAFEKYAARRFALEGYRFLVDVNGFRRAAENKGGQQAPTSWLRSKIRLIYNTYIPRDSPMELNISHKLVDDMKAKFTHCQETKEWAPDFFDPVFLEMTHNVLYNLWLGFVTDGELDEAMASGRRDSRGSKPPSKYTEELSVKG